MKQKLRRIMTELSLFWRYFFLLAAVVLVFLIAFTVATGQFTKTLRTSYLEQARSSFEKNAEMFASDLSLIHSLPTSMETMELYPHVARSNESQTVQYVFHLAELRDSFDQQCVLTDLPAESFIYFRDSGACLTRNRIFPEAEACFESYITYDNKQISMMNLLKEGELTIGFRLLPACDVSVGGRRESYLTVLTQSVGREAIYGFLYPVDTLEEYFQIESMPQGARFDLIRADGTVLYSSMGDGAEASDYIQLTCELPSLASKVSIGIPRAYFRMTVNRAQIAAQIIFLLSVLVGIAMCFFFSHISVRPFRRLIQSHATGQDAPGNELIAIDSFLKTAREKNVALRDMLLSSLLVRAFSGLTIPEGEYKKISAAFPLFHTPLRVAIVRDRAEDPDMEEENAGINRLHLALQDQFMCEYVNIQETVLLFPAEPALTEQLQGVLLELNAGTGGVRFVCGVSAPFEGVEMISQAIRQAQFCLPENGERVLVQMAQDEEQGALVEDMDLTQFQQALICWNRQEALIQIEQIAAFVGKNSAVRPQEPFYSALFLLRDSAHSARLSFEEYEHMTYQPTSSPVANLRRLKGVVDDLFEQKAAIQMTDKQVLCEQIVQYVKNNYSDPDLCMASLAKQFFVSERFVYNAVQESAGMNVSALLLQCRMQEAARLLRDTQDSVGVVAQKCGYPVESTFYRNFKKYYHMTPAEYKSAR